MGCHLWHSEDVLWGPVYDTQAALEKEKGKENTFKKCNTEIPTLPLNIAPTEGIRSSSQTISFFPWKHTTRKKDDFYLSLNKPPWELQVLFGAHVNHLLRGLEVIEPKRTAPKPIRSSNCWKIHAC